MIHTKCNLGWTVWKYPLNKSPDESLRIKTKHPKGCRDKNPQNKITEVQIMTVAEMWEALENMGVCEQALQLITNINGYNEETMLDILYAHTGEREFE